MMPGLMENRFHRVFGVREALIVPLFFAGFKASLRLVISSVYAKFKLSTSANLSSVPPNFTSISVSLFFATTQAFSEA